MTAIGPYKLAGKAVLAPMAGVTDFPFREICRQNGAALVTAEMAASNPRLRDTLKSQLRLANRNEPEPRIVQIVGTEAQQLADAARHQVESGAQIVDINMGCPAKKVCKKLAGSALLKDPALVERILRAVVNAVNVPVTLKIRTGWDHASRNAVEIARIAEQAGIASLALHGRTRACKFNGSAEYDTIAEVVRQVSLPVFANGDINSAAKAAQILAHTAADGVMIGRAAQGNPW
ncbi:MAG: tRNA dihydrouridine synthase DusB, partial [Pseudomonadales bacterium]|nr:tRNA dihydrouridine synthase DusB [Pseudomonadales bacterium]